MPPFSLDSVLRDKIKQYKRARSIYSRFFPCLTIKLLINYLNYLQSSSVIPLPDDIYGLINNHEWNDEKQTQIDICVAGSMLACFKAANIHDQINTTDEKALMYLKILARFRLLHRFNLAKQCFNIINGKNIDYIPCIAKALQILDKAGLLNNTNIEAISQHGGQYAAEIAMGLYIINKLDLLNADHGQVYCDAMTQYDEQYKIDLAHGLGILLRVELINGYNRNANLDTFLKTDAQYIPKINRVLMALNTSNLLPKGSKAQANFDLIISYTKHATEHHHGIEFLVQKIEQLNQQNQLTQTNYRSLFILPEDYTKTIKSDHSDIDKTKAETTVVTDYYQIIQLLFPEQFTESYINTFIQNNTNTDSRFLLIEILHFCEYLTTYLENKADEIPGYILKNTPILLTSFNLIFKALTLYDDKTMLESCIDIISFLLDHSSEIKDNIILLAAASIDSYDEFYSECDQFIMKAKIKFATKAVETKDKITIPYQSNFFSFPDNGNSQLSNKSNTISTINN